MVTMKKHKFRRIKNLQRVWQGGLFQKMITMAKNINLEKIYGQGGVAVRGHGVNFILFYISKIVTMENTLILRKGELQT